MKELGSSGQPPLIYTGNGDGTDLTKRGQEPLFIIILALGAVGSAGVLGVTRSAEVRGSSETAEGTQIVVDHVTFPLRFGITIYPLDRSAELVEELYLMGDEYESEPPEGATSNSLMWINERRDPGELHDGHVWFGRDNDLYHIVMQAPDLEWLQMWLPEFVHTDLTLTRPPPGL